MTTFNSGEGKSGWGERFDSAVAWRKLTFPHGESGYHKNKYIFGFIGSDHPSRRAFRQIRDFNPRGKLTHKEGKSVPWLSYEMDMIFGFGGSDNSPGQSFSKIRDFRFFEYPL